MPGPVQRPGAPRRVLWVEGKDDSAVVQSLCNQHEIPAVFRVLDKQGVEQIFMGLGVELRAPNLDCFAIVVDGNGEPASRWDSIRHILESHGYPELPTDLEASGVIVPRFADGPRFGAWIMPDNGAPGMLEDFAGSLIPPGDLLWDHASDVIDTLPERRFSEAHRSKALMHTWLAWQEGPGSPMGQAITKGHLDANAAPAHRFIAWLRRLMVDEPSVASE